MAVIEERRLSSSSVQPSIQGIGAIFGRRAFAWGAVFAGALVASALQLVCGLAVDPNSYLLGGQIPVQGLPGLAGTWYVIYTAGAMLVAGLIAGQTGGAQENRMLHGFVTWALSTVVGFYGLGIWAGQLNMGPAMTPFIGDGSLDGLALVSRGWMIAGMVVGLCAALFGASRSDVIPPERQQSY
jgi:hypothetical protein